MKTPAMDAAIELLQDRDDEHGDFEENHTNIGAVFGALLDSAGWDGGPVGAELAALMMAGMKLVRAAHRSDDDDYADAHAYLAGAESCREI